MNWFTKPSDTNQTARRCHRAGFCFDEGRYLKVGSASAEREVGLTKNCTHSLQYSLLCLDSAATLHKLCMSSGLTAKAQPYLVHSTCTIHTDLQYFSRTGLEVEVRVSSWCHSDVLKHLRNSIEHVRSSCFKLSTFLQHNNRVLKLLLIRSQYFYAHYSAGLE